MHEDKDEMVSVCLTETCRKSDFQGLDWTDDDEVCERRDGRTREGFLLLASLSSSIIVALLTLPRGLNSTLPTPTMFQKYARLALSPLSIVG